MYNAWKIPDKNWQLVQNIKVFSMTLCVLKAPGHQSSFQMEQEKAMLWLRDVFLSSLTTRCITNTEPEKKKSNKSFTSQHRYSWENRRGHDDDSPILQKLLWSVFKENTSQDIITHIHTYTLSGICTLQIYSGKWTITSNCHTQHERICLFASLLRYKHRDCRECRVNCFWFVWSRKSNKKNSGSNTLRK